MTDTANNPVLTFIEKAVADYPVVLFMKGVPDRPQCGFSNAVVQILDHLDVEYVGVDVLQDDALRQAIKDYSSWPTIPQLYVKGEFVGGADIVREMYMNGELATLLRDKGIEIKE